MIGVYRIVFKGWIHDSLILYFQTGETGNTAHFVRCPLAQCILAMPAAPNRYIDLPNGVDCLGQEPFLEVEDCVAMPYPDSLVCETYSTKTLSPPTPLWTSVIIRFRMWHFAVALWFNADMCSLLVCLRSTQAVMTYLFEIQRTFMRRFNSQMQQQGRVL